MEKNEVSKMLGMSDIMYDVLDNITEGIMIIDTEFKITYANENLLNMLGMKKGDVVGDNCYRVTHGREEVCGPPDHECPVARFYETGKPEGVIHKHKDKGGKEFFTEVTAYPIKDESDEIVGFVRISRSISDDVLRTINNLKKIEKDSGESKEAAELKKKIKEL